MEFMTSFPLNTKQFFIDEALENHSGYDDNEGTKHQCSTKAEAVAEKTESRTS